MAETKNNVDQLVYQTENLMKEHKDALTETNRKEIEDALQKLRDVKEGADVTAMKQAMEKLNTVAQEFGTRVYEKAAAGAAQPGTGGSGGSASSDQGASQDSDNVIDADFEVKE